MQAKGHIQLFFNSYLLHLINFIYACVFASEKHKYDKSKEYRNILMVYFVIFLVMEI